MQKIPPKHFLEFIEHYYPIIRQWVHENDAYINDAKNYPLSNSPIQVPCPNKNIEISDKVQYLLLRYFGKIRAWVHKNEELRQACDTGYPHHRPRLMQTKFEDFLALEGWL
jgi:hypothetical protein